MKFKLESAAATSKTKKPLKKSNLFAENENENEDEDKDWNRQEDGKDRKLKEELSETKIGFESSVKMTNREIQDSNRRNLSNGLGIQRTALEQDASIFAYDEIYDDLKLAQEREKLKKMNVKSTKEAKYIHGMMKQAFDRSKDNQKFIEKKAKEEVEMELEGVSKGDIQVFVTDTYAKKQEEIRRLEEEEKKMEAMNTAASNGGSYAGFYRNLINARVAVHEAVDKSLSSKSKVDDGKDQEVHQEEEEIVVDKEDLQRRGEYVLKRDAEGLEILSGGLNVLKKQKVSNNDKRSNVGGTYNRTLFKSMQKQEEDEETRERERLSRVFQDQMQKMEDERKSKELKLLEDAKLKVAKKTEDVAIAEAKRRAEERKKARLEKMNVPQ